MIKIAEKMNTIIKLTAAEQDSTIGLTGNA